MLPVLLYLMLNLSASLSKIYTPTASWAYLVRLINHSPPPRVLRTQHHKRVKITNLLQLLSLFTWQALRFTPLSDALDYVEGYPLSSLENMVSSAAVPGRCPKYACFPSIADDPGSFLTRKSGVGGTAMLMPMGSTDCARGSCGLSLETCTYCI